MANSRPNLEIGVERVLFASRWILAPFYLGMVVALAVILVVFVRALVTDLAHIPTMDAEQAILLTLPDRSVTDGQPAADRYLLRVRELRVEDPC